MTEDTPTAAAEPTPTGLTITPQHVENQICEEHYHQWPGSTLTTCRLVLRNGFSVTGESACVSPENFNVELGQQIARRKAAEKIWELEGYLLADRIANAKAGKA